MLPSEFLFLIKILVDNEVVESVLDNGISLQGIVVNEIFVFRINV